MHVCYNKVLLYRGSFHYSLLFKGRWKSFVILRTSLYRFFCRDLLNQGSTVLTTFLPKLNNKFHSWKSIFFIQSSQHLVLISGLGLNFQLFVLRLTCTFQGILHPPHLACLLIKGNKAGYQCAGIPRILKTNELPNLLGLLYASI